MSYYARDLVTLCKCATLRDAEWFMEHPDRCKYVRGPWGCEVTQLEPEHVGILSQIVAVWMDQPVNSYLIEQGQIIPVRIYRRSFLFVGEADWHKIDSDEGVDRFMYFINDDANHSGARPN